MASTMWQEWLGVAPGAIVSKLLPLGKFLNNIQTLGNISNLIYLLRCLKKNSNTRFFPIPQLKMVRIFDSYFGSYYN